MAMTELIFALPTEEIEGYIFLCTDYSMPLSFERQTFGLPGLYFESVRAIRPGTPLFLYNLSTGCFHGIFEATSHGGLNIDPYAWPIICEPGRSFYPSQVRVTWRRQYPPLPLVMSNSVLAILRVFEVPEVPVYRFRAKLLAHEVRCITNYFRVNEAVGRLRYR